MNIKQEGEIREVNECKDDLHMKGNKNGTHYRINELTIAVERFLNSQKTRSKENGAIIVDKDLFLESLIDVNITESKSGDIKAEYNFLNERINKKFYNIYNNNCHHYTIEELVSDIQYKIVNHLKDKIDTEINYKAYRRFRDDISYIIFLMDKEINREILEQNYIYYNRNKQNGDNKYFSPFHFIYLDAEEEDAHNKHDSITNDYIDPTLSYDELLEQEEEQQRIEDMIEAANLTKRQDEVLRTLIDQGFNQTDTAKAENVSVKTINKIVKRIRDRFKIAFSDLEDISITTINNKTKRSYIERFDDLLASDFTDKDVLDFIIEHINASQDIEELFYLSGTVKERKETIRYMKGLTFDEYLVRRHLRFIICNYYKKYSK